MGKIAVFDSGVGGITVLEAIYKLLPNEDYIYFGDSLNAPYGDLTNDQIKEHSFKIVDFLKKNDAKIIVIACNTVTSFLFKDILNYSKLPVVGVIFPTVDYVNDLHISKVGLIATVRTIENGAYQKMMEKKVYELKTPEFVPMIEDGSYVNRGEEIKEILSPLLTKNIHALVLGCTHYPFLRDKIEEVYSGIIVDSSYVTALKVKNKLERRNLLENNPNVRIYVSGDVDKFEFVIKDFVSFKYEIEKKEL